MSRLVTVTGEAKRRAEPQRKRVWIGRFSSWQ